MLAMLSSQDAQCMQLIRQRIDLVKISHFFHMRSCNAGLHFPGFESNRFIKEDALGVSLVRVRRNIS